MFDSCEEGKYNLSVNIKVQFFAVLKERAGAESVQFQMEEGATLNDLKKELRERYGNALKLNSSIVFAVNGVVVQNNIKLKHNDRVALLPPVSGG